MCVALVFVCLYLEMRREPLSLPFISALYGTELNAPGIPKPPLRLPEREMGIRKQHQKM